MFFFDIDKEDENCNEMEKAENEKKRLNFLLAYAMYSSINRF